MKKSKRAVKQFKRTYKIKGVPNAHKLKHVIKEFGFEVYGYSESEDKLHETKTYNLSKEKPAFTYVRGNQKIVFYDDRLNEIDLLRVLSHEIGHIYYNHLHRKEDIFDTDINKEWEANLFAVCLLSPVNYKDYIVKTILSFCLATMCFSFGTHYDGRFLKTDTDILNETINSEMPSELTPEQRMNELFSETGESESSQPVQTDETNEQIEYVYITPTGTRYHKSTCRYGENYPTSVKIPKSDVEKNYVACKLCNPNE